MKFWIVIFKCILVIGGWGSSCGIALIWISQVLIDDKSTLVQVMAWCRQATSHYLSQCWPGYMSPYGITRPWWVNYPGVSCWPFTIMLSDQLNDICNHQYCQTSNISHTLVGNKIVDHSDVVRASPVRAASATSLFSTLTPGFRELGKDHCKRRGETFKFWDFVHLILEVWPCSQKFL